MSKRLSDTVALSSQPINPPRAVLASDSWSAPDSADGAVRRDSLGRFRRETGAGSHSLAEACRTACGDSKE